VKAARQYNKEKVPMAENNIYKIIENAMDEKYKYDLSKPMPLYPL